MNIFYRRNKLEKQLSNASEIKRAFGVLAKRISQRKTEIEDSDTLAILMQIPAAKCHPLTADKRGQWSVHISGNFRIIFEIADNPIPLRDDGSVDTESVKRIYIIDIEDYH